jgi:hypothetical protein
MNNLKASIGHYYPLTGDCKNYSAIDNRKKASLIKYKCMILIHFYMTQLSDSHSPVANIGFYHPPAGGIAPR